MNWFSIIGLAAILAVNGGGGVTTSPGIAQFWRDDYKVFDQIYGRTSDKDLYRRALTPSFNYGVDITKFKKTDALQFKNQLAQPTDDDDVSASGSQVDAYGFGDNFSHLRDRVKYSKDLTKPTKGMNKLVYNLYKPISEDTDPETFDYLKHLEQLGKQESIDFPQEGLGGFQPYIGSFRDTNTGVESYRSIQDILDSQEVKVKQKDKNIEEDDVKYVNYPQAQKQKPRSNKPNVRLNQGNHLNAPRCGGKGQVRCRKRSTSYGRYRPRARAVVRKIKHTIISD